MSPLSYGASERWILSCPHPGQKAPNELGTESSAGAEGGESTRPQYAGSEHGRPGAKEHGQNRPAGV